MRRDKTKAVFILAIRQESYQLRIFYAVAHGLRIFWEGVILRAGPQACDHLIEIDPLKVHRAGFVGHGKVLPIRPVNHGAFHIFAALGRIEPKHVSPEVIGAAFGVNVFSIGALGEDIKASVLLEVKRLIAVRSRPRADELGVLGRGGLKHVPRDGGNFGGFGDLGISIEFGIIVLVAYAAYVQNGDERYRSDDRGGKPCDRKNGFAAVGLRLFRIRLRFRVKNGVFGPDRIRLKAAVNKVFIYVRYGVEHFCAFHFANSSFKNLLSRLAVLERRLRTWFSPMP